jgi:hypothetical protein
MRPPAWMYAYHFWLCLCQLTPCAPGPYLGVISAHDGWQRQQLRGMFETMCSGNSYHT